MNTALAAGFSKEAGLMDWVGAGLGALGAGAGAAAL